MTYNKYINGFLILIFLGAVAYLIGLAATLKTDNEMLRENYDTLQNAYYEHMYKEEHQIILDTENIYDCWNQEEKQTILFKKKHYPNIDDKVHNLEKEEVYCLIKPNFDF